MSFIKLGEIIEIHKIESADSCIPSVSAEVLEKFQKFAQNLKKVAPKAEDFLYFSAIMMHAAEAAGIHDDGTPKLTSRGEPVQVGWDKGGGTWRWMSNDPNVKPYKNSNGDIFPEEELVKAHKKWKDKPLCIDHKSSSVDHVRGFIVDTYYDRHLKRVVALCALDKAGWPQLARQVMTGVSNCVSMGTAVGKAICSDCARVAKTESDFCDHMRRKSCYGEINVDLNPLELSIVVNGADPKANIKHIIAAANTLNNYVDNKQKELQKMADSFNANLSFTDGSSTLPDGGTVTNVSITSKDIESFRKDVDKAIGDFQKLQNSLSEEEKASEHTNDSVSDQALSLGETPAADSGLPPPHARYASAEIGAEAINDLRRAMKNIESKLEFTKTSLDKLASATTNKHEENMSGANMNKQGYYQGGGGVNEPAPGQAKYPKDPLQEHLREKEDRQMVGQTPFPSVGPVDGMHPSPGSVDPSDELERKKMLARAEAEEKAQRRQAIVAMAKQALESKQAYHQGGGGVNEPAKPGTQKYPVDKLEYTLREKEDKHMVGQKPFPGVGPVDGLHPSPSSAETSDELKRKEMLRRASLRAKFDRVKNSDGTPNLGKSAWQVFLGDQLILTASVSELSGGQSEMMFDSIATKDFGSKLIEKVKAYGADRIGSMIKKAQDPGPSAGGASVPPPADSSAPPPAAPDAPPAEDTGKSGDPATMAKENAEKLRDLASDQLEVINALTGEKNEMGEGAPDAGAPAPEMGVAASFGTETLNTLRKELNSTLTKAMKESVAALHDHAQELDMIAGLYDKGAVNSTNQEFVGSVVEDALNESKSALADGFQLMAAFVKYARGTQAIVKRAEIEAGLEALAEGETMTSEHDSNSGDDLMAMLSEDTGMGDDLGLGEDTMGEDFGLADLLSDDAVPADANDLEVSPGEPVPAELKPGTHLEVAASYNSRRGRDALRAKLAADALGKEEDGEIQDMSHATWSDMLQEADHLADGQTELEVKPSDNLGRVETLPEINKAMMEIAKAPPKVRKEAEAIHMLVSEGKLDPSDLDALIAEGLDKDAVAYWKKYYGQTEGGGEFASELVKEHVKAQLEEAIETYKVKIARAYELAYDMVDRGLCASERSNVSAQVEEIMKFNDDSFESLKKQVVCHKQVLSVLVMHSALTQLLPPKLKCIQHYPQRSAKLPREASNLTRGHHE